MHITPVDLSLHTPLAPSQTSSGMKSNDETAAFDVMFYRMLLQTAKWTAAGPGGQHAEQALFGDMVTDFLAQAAARQQQTFGAMLLNGVDQPGKGKT